MRVRNSTASQDAIRRFCERAEELGANGLDFQHAAICERRCWLHLRRASLNDWSALIRLGEARHAGSHVRDTSASGLDGLRPDRVDWEARAVIEQKNSSSHVEASLGQAFFYAALLSRASGEPWSVGLNIGPSRRSTKHDLDVGRIASLDALLEVIARLKGAPKIPDAALILACSGCSNSPLCWPGR